MDLNDLYKREQISLFRADNASCDGSRRAHQAMADAYASLIVGAKGDQSARA
jgi:hypothetical protein